MPLYEYKCRSCGEIFEVIQKFSDSPLEAHDACGGPLERLISASALQFKGTGWYVTDYASGNGKSQQEKDGKKESAASSDASAKSETKSSSTAPAGTSDKKV